MFNILLINKVNPKKYKLGYYDQNAQHINNVAKQDKKIINNILKIANFQLYSNQQINRKSKLYHPQQSQTICQKISIKQKEISIIQNLSIQKFVEESSINSIFLNQMEHKVKQKQISVHLQKQFLQILKTQSYVISNQASSLYYSENIIILGSIYFRLILCYQLILYDNNPKNLSNFMINKLKHNIQLLLIKYQHNRIKINNFCSATIQMFQTYHNGKSCLPILKQEQIKQLLSYLQQKISSYLFFIQAITKYGNQTCCSMMKKLKAEMELP